MKNTALNSEHESRKLAALPAENAREANSRGGSIGWAAAPLHGDEARPAGRARRRGLPSTSALSQPASLPRISPHTMPSARR